MLREHSSSRKAFSAIFVYVSTAGTVYTEQKQKKRGREKSQILSYAGDLLAEIQHKQGPNQTQAADLWKSHAKACWHRAQQRQRSPLPLGSKRESHSYTMLFIRLPQNEPIPSNSSQKTPSIHPQVPPPPTGIREQTAAIHTVFSLGAKELTTGHRQNLTTCHPSDTALNPNKISRNL